MLELVLILFTINTWIVITKLLLDMIMSIKQKMFNTCLKDSSCKQRIKWEKSNKKILKINNDIIDIKTSDARLLKIYKKSYKNIGI